MKAASSLTPIVDTNEFTSSSQSIYVTIVSIEETESIVSSIQPFRIDEIGCSPFLQMYGYNVERLSLQAHSSAQQRDGDEYVVDAILSYKKLEVLIRTLLAIEAWRTLVLVDRPPPADEDATNASILDNHAHLDGKEDNQDSKLASKIAENQASLRCAFTLHVETTICSLINLILYRKENAQELDSDSSLALVDYCARQMVLLAAPLEHNPMLHNQKHPGTAQEIAARIQGRTTLEGIRDNRLETEFKTAVIATSLARHLCEHIESLPIGAQTRILDTHDYLQMMIPLIDEPPWTRRRRISGDVIVWEKIQDNHEWKQVAPSDLLQITQCEAQCWIAIFHLTCSNLCRHQYALNVFRKEQLLRLRKYLNEVMLDQLPILTDVMRYMDELALLNVSETSTGQGAALLMQQVDRFREDTVRSCQELDELVERQSSTFFSTSDAKDEDLRLIAGIYSEDNLGSLCYGIDGLGTHPLVEVASIGLGCMQDGVMVNVCNLTPTDKEAILQTDSGEIRRTKLRVHYTNPDEPFRFGKHLILEAALSGNEISNFKTLTLQSSLSQRKDCAMEWVQLGRSEDGGFALQLGFKVSRRSVPTSNSNQPSFELRQAFISQQYNKCSPSFGST